MSEYEESTNTMWVCRCSKESPTRCKQSPTVTLETRECVSCLAVATAAVLVPTEVTSAIVASPPACAPVAEEAEGKAAPALLAEALAELARATNADSAGQADEADAPTEASEPAGTMGAVKAASGTAASLVAAL